MNTYSLPALYVVVVVLAFANCVREIDFQQPEADPSALVVSGVFTDGFGPHVLHLTRPGNYDRRNFPTVSGATVRLLDDLGNVFSYQEIFPVDKAPFYRLDGIKGETGRTYTLEIDLPDGQRYRSHPQEMPEPLPLDTLEVHGEWLYFNTSDGIVVREPYAFAYARTRAPAHLKDHYLHWESDATYIFNEFAGPAQHQCFVNNRLNDQLVALADLQKYEPGAVVYENVGRRKIDQAFEWKISFAAYQRSVGREAYEYWEKVNRLLAANGTIFDTPPAAVPGNVDNLSHPDQPALGFFEVGAADTCRIFTANGALGQEFLWKRYPYCRYDYQTGQIPRECSDCLRWLTGATYEIPWWWH